MGSRRWECSVGRWVAKSISKYWVGEIVVMGLT